MRRILRAKLLNTFFALFLAICLIAPVMAASAAGGAAPPDSFSSGAAKSSGNSSAADSQEDIAPAAIPTKIQPIGFGQTINGTLTTTDPLHPDYSDSYSDAYIFTGTAEQQIAITMTSPDFGPHISLYKTDGEGAGVTTMTLVGRAGGYTSPLPSTICYSPILPTTGKYVIIASHRSSYKTGSYSLRLSQVPAVSIGYGQTINGQLSATDPTDPGDPLCYADAYRFSGTAGQQIVITMTSSSYQTFLRLYKIDGTVKQVAQLNGNSGLPSTARIALTLSESGRYAIFASSGPDYQIGSYSLTLSGSAATPTFSPAGGTYSSAQTVTISTATSGATIRYTTNGAEPTATSAIYTAPLTIGSSTTLKAKAFKTSLTNSATATAVYTIAGGTVATPTFSLASGTYASAQTVTISTATSGATIRYTTNGTEPTATSAIYTTPLTIGSSMTLKAKAFKAGMTNSATATAVYTISSSKMYNIQITASAGGTVSPIGLKQVAAGGSLTLTIAPNNGYAVKSVNVTSVLENATGSMEGLSEPLAAIDNTHTIYNIQTDKIVSIVFQPLTYSVSGKITANSLTGTALSGATVTIGGKSATTAADGTYKVAGVPVGSQTMTVSKTGYATKTQTVAVTQSLTNVNLFLVPVYTVSGTITSGSLTGAALPSATVKLKSGTTVVKTTTTGTTGLYSLTLVPAGSYTVEVSKTGYVTKTQSITVSGNLSNINLYLVKQTTTVAR